MLKLLQRDKARGVVIHKIDRSARNLKDWADLGELIDQGIEVYFANESLDLHSRSGRLSADIQAVVAADYIRNLREEAKKGIYGRLKQGFYPMRAPLGYVDNGSGKPKTIHPQKGPLVKKAFELYASAKFTIDPLVDELYRLGLRNHAGGKVTRNGLSTILNNPFYMGLIRIKQTNEYYPGIHEPLITKRLFDEVQDMLTGRYNARTKTHDLTFRRFITCACGYSLIGEIQKGNVYYRCQIKDCPTKTIREETVQSLVNKELQRLQFSQAERQYFEDAIKLLKTNWFAEKEKHVTALSVKREQVTERLNRLTDAFLDQAIERELYEEKKTALLFERRGVEDQLSSFKTNQRSIPDELQQFLELAGDMYSLYKTASVEKKRRLLKTVTSNCTIRDKTLDFAFTIPFRTLANREIYTDGGPSKGIHRTWDALLDSLVAQSRAGFSLTTTPESELQD
jgi:DNA invertase Pin-like site-specific DNA recombinase